VRTGSDDEQYTHLYGATMPETKVASTMRAGVLTPSFDTHMHTTETAACSAEANKRQKNKGNEYAMYTRRKESHSLRMLRITLPAANPAHACASHRHLLHGAAAPKVRQHESLPRVRSDSRPGLDTSFRSHNSRQHWLPAAQSILSSRSVYLPTTMMPA
jgi:hypothetical protein